MKSIYKIKIHPFLYLIMFICILTGLFKELCLFMLIIIMHESGHILAGLCFKQKIEKIILLPFGGLTIFNMKLNISCFKEIIIALMGPMFQIIGYIVLKKIIHNNLFYYYNLVILIFNLIPIYPLDGYKIVNALINKKLCFRISFFISNLISVILIIISLIIIILFNINYSMFIIMIILLIKNYQEIKNYAFLFNKFLLERYTYHLTFKKIKYIKKIKNMYKDKRHLIKIGNKWYTEREILQKRFDL